MGQRGDGSFGSRTSSAAQLSGRGKTPWLTSVILIHSSSRYVIHDVILLMKLAVSDIMCAGTGRLCTASAAIQG